MSMFCFQCQEALKNTGCQNSKGACGKTDDVAALQDLLIYATKGISLWAEKARTIGLSDPQVDYFVAEALFVTVTNVNFDPEAILEFIRQAITVRDQVKTRFISAYLEKTGERFTEKMADAAEFHINMTADACLNKARLSGVLATENEDIRSLRELLIYGLKGVATYAVHAHVLDHQRNDIFVFLQTALAATTDDSRTADDLVDLILRCGEVAVNTMALLDEANTTAFGVPEVTEVAVGLQAGPGILVSGHDLRDLAELLKQTENMGIKVYTHGEMLPALAYPGLKKYSHLVGHFGSGWYNQDQDFRQFTGAILMTTNCLIKPEKAYQDRLFTTGVVGWPGLQHIPHPDKREPKNFKPVIEKALACGPLNPADSHKLTIGFHHQTVMGVAEQVITAVKSGDIKRFVVMAGCDGRHVERKYYTDVARNLPQDAVILTAGCAKYRYNALDLGDINGIPRIIDAGQCNDSYSLAVVALKLKEAFGLEDINDLPISYDIAWYEQKAVCVLLGLLHLGVKGIRLGPTLPAFLSPNVAKILMETFDIKPIGTVADDVAAIMAGA